MSDVSDVPGPDEEVDLTAEPGTPEGDRAQDQIMREGAAAASTELPGPAPAPGADEEETAGP